MRVFWRQDELTDAEVDLFQAVMAAHDRSARRQNISAAVLVAAGQGSGEFRQALAAAMMCFGGPHGPLRAAYGFMDLSQPEQREWIAEGKRVPGWGNAFVKGAPDPEWAGVDRRLRALSPEVMARVDWVTGELGRRGKKLFPNPGGYTATAGRVLKVPPELLDWLLFRGRLDAWAEMFLKREER